METLILSKSEISRLLQIEECMDAVEEAFCLYAKGKANPPGLMGIHTEEGGFHIKAGVLQMKKPYFVAKLNANFPNNRKRFALPTIQGVVMVCDAENGRLLSLMDSMEITILRTGAATGVAAKYLALPNAEIATIYGCGNQGRISLKALLNTRNLRKVFLYDQELKQAEKLLSAFNGKIELVVVDKKELPLALSQSQVIVTCTTSKEPLIKTENIQPGTFIAAVGADSEDKQELFPELVASSKIVADLVEQCAKIGELHHAIDKGLVGREDVHAELGEIIAGIKAGRESEKEIILFDSTGTALQDVAAASVVYEKAIAIGMGRQISFSD